MVITSKAVGLCRAKEIALPKFVEIQGPSGTPSLINVDHIVRIMPGTDSGPSAEQDRKGVVVYLMGSTPAAQLTFEDRTRSFNEWRGILADAV